jgi:predicted transcriptional regulator
MKERTSFTLSPECKHLLQLLAAKLGLSQASVIEMAVRQLAERERSVQEAKP